MWSARVIAIAALTGLLLSPLAAAALGPQATQETLPNGAVLLVSEQRNLPLVLIRVVLDAGSRRDPMGKGGLANLTAHLVTEGTTTRSAQQIKDQIDFIGASLDADADQDYAVLSLQVLRKDLDTGLDLLADILLHPAFKADELTRQRESVLATLRGQDDDPTTVAQKAFQRTLFGDTPYGHPVDGTPASVAPLSRADVQHFYASYYRPAGAAVVVVGDISTDEVRPALMRALAAWDGTPPPPFVYPPFTPPAAQTVRIDRPVTQAGIVLGDLGVARDNPDYETIAVMNYILGGGGFSSRLMDNIRTQAGLAYSVGSFFAAGKSPGPFEIVMQTKNASIADAVARAHQEVDRIRDEAVTDDELQEAKRYLTGSYPLRLDSNAKIADFIAQTWFYGLGLNYADVYIARVNAVTGDDVSRVARQYLHPDRFIEVVVTAGETSAPPPPAAPHPGTP
ncbi:MAG TPA: pitrilysin family protein [Candidatus Dormibacteraeota bacterium]|nr:pitrilysin family protein [Candidatus Dormibacteraeota bacterium]